MGNNSTTPSSTVVVGSGGEYCSTTASPVMESTMNNSSDNKIGGEPTILSSLFVSGGVGRSPDPDMPHLDQLYMYGGGSSTPIRPPAVVGHWD